MPKRYLYTYEINVLKRLQGITNTFLLVDLNMHTTLHNIPTTGKSVRNNAINTTEVKF